MHTAFHLTLTSIPTEFSGVKVFREEQRFQKLMADRVNHASTSIDNGRRKSSRRQVAQRCRDAVIDGIAQLEGPQPVSRKNNPSCQL
jgi:hypothetical protein